MISRISSNESVTKTFMKRWETNKLINWKVHVTEDAVRLRTSYCFFSFSARLLAFILNGTQFFTAYFYLRFANHRKNLKQQTNSKERCFLKNTENDQTFNEKITTFFHWKKLLHEFLSLHTLFLDTVAALFRYQLKSKKRFCRLNRTRSEIPLSGRYTMIYRELTDMYFKVMNATAGLPSQAASEVLLSHDWYFLSRGTHHRLHWGILNDFVMTGISPISHSVKPYPNPDWIHIKSLIPLLRHIPPSVYPL